MFLLQPPPYFLVNVLRVALRFRSEMESRLHESQTYRKAHVIKQGRLKDQIVCSVLLTMK